MNHRLFRVQIWNHGFLKLAKNGTTLGLFNHKFKHYRPGTSGLVKTIKICCRCATKYLKTTALEARISEGIKGIFLRSHVWNRYE